MMRLFARIDAAGILVGALLLNHLLEGSWALFIVFAILPDVTLLAYIKRTPPYTGPAMLYNAAHLYAAPLILAVLLIVWGPEWLEPIYLTGWVAHIAVDRLLGFGFKGPHSFWETHLQAIPPDAKAGDAAESDAPASGMDLPEDGDTPRKDED